MELTNRNLEVFELSQFFLHKWRKLIQDKNETEMSATFLKKKKEQENFFSVLDKLFFGLGNPVSSIYFFEVSNFEK